MTDLYIGLATTFVTILILELLRKFDKRLIAAYILVGIAFIYVGFAWYDTTSLVLVILGGSIFMALAYFGYKKNFLFVIFGLVLHGVWDMVFPFFSSAAPDGYGIFCSTIDVLLAIYLYVRIKPRRPILNH